MKKLLVLLAALALVAAACGDGEAGDDGDTGDTGDDGATTTTTQAATTTTEAGDEGLMMGMTAEELVDAGYVVVRPGENIRIGASVALTGPIPDPGRDIGNGAELGVDDVAGLRERMTNLASKSVSEIMALYDFPIRELE